MSISDRWHATATVQVNTMLIGVLNAGSKRRVNIMAKAKHCPAHVSSAANASSDKQASKAQLVEAG